MCCTACWAGKHASRDDGGVAAASTRGYTQGTGIRHVAEIVCHSAITIMSGPWRHYAVHGSYSMSGVRAGPFVNTSCLHLYCACCNTHQQLMAQHACLPVCLVAHCGCTRSRCTLGTAHLPQGSTAFAYDGQVGMLCCAACHACTATEAPMAHQHAHTHMCRQPDKQTNGTHRMERPEKDCTSAFLPHSVLLSNGTCSLSKRGCAPASAR